MKRNDSYFENISSSPSYLKLENAKPITWWSNLIGTDVDTDINYNNTSRFPEVVHPSKNGLSPGPDKNKIYAKGGRHSNLHMASINSSQRSYDGDSFANDLDLGNAN